MNKNDTNAEFDFDESKLDPLDNPKWFVIRSIKNAHFSKQITAVYLKEENNLLITASETLAFTWEYDSFKFAGVCIAKNLINSLMIEEKNERLYAFVFDGNINIFEIACSFAFQIYKLIVLVDMSDQSFKNNIFINFQYSAISKHEWKDIII